MVVLDPAGPVARTDRRRLYLADVDSVRQAEAVTGAAGTWGPRSVPAALRGLIRMSVLAGGRLVLTDAQLLDGRVLLALGPAAFGQLVCAEPVDGLWPLEVCMRQDALEACLRAMLAPQTDGSAPLATYEFSVIDDSTLRREIARRLAEHTVAELDDLVRSRGGVVQGVVAMLRACGLDDVQADALERTWLAWCGSSARFTTTLKVVPRAALNGAPDQRSLQLVERALERIGAPRACAEALELIADPTGSITTRSRAYVDVLDPLRRADPRHELGADILRDWVDAWYHRSMAEAIGADVIEGRIGSERARARHWDDRHLLTLDADIARELGEMPSEVFAGLRYRTRHDATAWWNAGRGRRRGAHRRLALALEQEVEQSSVTRLVVSSVFKVFVLVAAVVISGLDLSGWGKTWALAAAALVSALPELYEMARLRGGRLDRRFRVARGRRDRRPVELRRPR